MAKLIKKLPMPKTNKIIREFKKKFLRRFTYPRYLEGKSRYWWYTEASAHPEKVWNWIEKHISKIEKEAEERVIEKVIKIIGNSAKKAEDWKVLNRVIKELEKSNQQTKESR